MMKAKHSAISLLKEVLNILTANACLIYGSALGAVMGSSHLRHDNYFNYLNVQVENKIDCIIAYHNLKLHSSCVIILK